MHILHQSDQRRWPLCPWPHPWHTSPPLQRNMISCNFAHYKLRWVIPWDNREIGLPIPRVRYTSGILVGLLMNWAKLGIKRVNIISLICDRTVTGNHGRLWPSSDRTITLNRYRLRERHLPNSVSINLSAIVSSAGFLSLLQEVQLVRQSKLTISCALLQHLYNKKLTFMIYQQAGNIFSIWLTVMVTGLCIKQARSASALRNYAKRHKEILDQ